MAKRQNRPNENPGEISNPRGITITAAGHSGHVIDFHADYAYWCQTDSAYVNEDLITSKKPHK